MSVERGMQAVGTALGLAVAALLLADTLLDNNLSETSRLLVMAIAGVAFCWVTVRQGMIAYKYEGIPIWPPAFRWVVCLWFASLALLVGWILMISVDGGVYSPLRSTLIWLLFAEATIYFLTRWVSVGRPQIAGPGETGSNT